MASRGQATDSPPVAAPAAAAAIVATAVGTPATATTATAQEAIASNARRVIRGWPVGAALDSSVDGESGLEVRTWQRRIRTVGGRGGQIASAPLLFVRMDSGRSGTWGIKRRRVRPGRPTDGWSTELRLIIRFPSSAAVSHLDPIHVHHPSFFLSPAPPLSSTGMTATEGLPFDEQLERMAPEVQALLAEGSPSADVAAWRDSQLQAIMQTAEMRQVMQDIASDPSYGSLYALFPSLQIPTLQGC